jgi:pyruvate formate-lyase activating enzyme-like uncharacterized protein
LRRVTCTSADSLLLGRMPRGCQLCIRGAKLVLFVTGLCKRGCFYCPLSEKRRNKDRVYANERPVKSNKDIFDEGRLIDALGTGVTGGDPSIRFKRVLRYIILLKQKFGKNHHIHMYCCSKLPSKQLRELKKAGLDEIRFHTWSVEPVKAALKADLRTGVEIPAIPGEFKRTRKLLKELDSIGCDFVNMNEFEFSDTNLAAMKARGFKIKSDVSMGVKGSEEMAIKLMRWAARNTHLNIHYCPSSLKDRVQLRNRLKRRARNVAKPFEEITDEGLLIKGVIYGLPKSKLDTVRKLLIFKYRAPSKLVFIDREKNRIELPSHVAEKLAKLEPALNFALVEEYPTYDRLETTFIPI